MKDERQKSLAPYVNQLVINIRSKTGLCDEAMSDQEVLREIASNANDEFNELFDLLYPVGKRRILRIISEKRTYEIVYLDIEDILQEFFVRKLPKVILKFDPEENKSFTSYFEKAVKNFCLDHLRKYLPPKVKTGEGDDVYIREFKTISLEDFPAGIEGGVTQFTTKEEQDVRAECVILIEIAVYGLDALKSNVDKILGYHCRELLPALPTRDYNGQKILEKLHGKTFQEVSTTIENMYADALEQQQGQKTIFMEGLNKRIESKNLADEIFLEGVEVKDIEKQVGVWVSEVKRALKKHIPEMRRKYIDNIK